MSIITTTAVLALCGRVAHFKCGFDTIDLLNSITPHLIYKIPPTFKILPDNISLFTFKIEFF